MANDGGNALETILVNIGVGLAAAAVGVWGGVQVHGAEIEEIKRRLNRMESKQDRMMEHFAIRWIDGDEDN